MSTTTELTELKINYLTEAQYQAEVSGGTIDENALYMTPASGGGGSGISIGHVDCECTVGVYDAYLYVSYVLDSNPGIPIAVSIRYDSETIDSPPSEGWMTFTGSVDYSAVGMYVFGPGLGLGYEAIFEEDVSYDAVVYYLDV